MVNFDLTRKLNIIFYQNKSDVIKQLSDLMWKEGLYFENVAGGFKCMSCDDEITMYMKMYLEKDKLGYYDLMCSIDISGVCKTIASVSSMEFKLEENCYHIKVYDTCDYDNLITEYMLKPHTAGVK
jgi:hypothetical protein